MESVNPFNVLSKENEVEIDKDKEKAKWKETDNDKAGNGGNGNTSDLFSYNTCNSQEKAFKLVDNDEDSDVEVNWVLAAVFYGTYNTSTGDKDNLTGASTPDETVLNV